MLTPLTPELVAQRDQADRMMSIMLTMPQVEIPVEHTFGPGFYARTIRIPAGTTLAGKAHSTEHVFAISEGSLALVADGETQIAKAPFQVIGKPGKRRLGYALTDVVCTNVHLTTETDLVKLEAMLVEPEALLPQAASEALL